MPGGEPRGGGGPGLPLLQPPSLRRQPAAHLRQAPSRRMVQVKETCPIKHKKCTAKKQAFTFIIFSYLTIPLRLHFFILSECMLLKKQDFQCV